MPLHISQWENDRADPLATGADQDDAPSIFINRFMDSCQIICHSPNLPSSWSASSYGNFAAPSFLSQYLFCRCFVTSLLVMPLCLLFCTVYVMHKAVIATPVSRAVQNTSCELHRIFTHLLNNCTSHQHLANNLLGALLLRPPISSLKCLPHNARNRENVQILEKESRNWDCCSQVHF